jgi:signal transduction histidine kinase
MTLPMSWSEFFAARLPHIYLVYGLAFFVLGLAVALEIGRTERTQFSWAMQPLAFFGLVHGSHEWIEMLAMIGAEAYGFRPSTGFDALRLVLLAVSFVALTAFGVRMLDHPPQRLRHLDLWVSLGMLLLYGLGVLWLGRWLGWQLPAWLAAADVLARYGLAIPGAVLTAAALLTQRQAFLRSNQAKFANDLLWAALAFLAYGGVGQFFVGNSPLFPSNILNAQAFQSWFGIPIQLFRATMAGIIAVFTIRALRAFEFSRQQELADARRRVAEEISRRNALCREFLHRTVKTQEEERRRIARELHDELGQVLTGLAIGLRGAQTSLDRPGLLGTQLKQLEDMAVQALGSMRHLVDELRPAVLDDMGLPAALRHRVENFASLSGVKTSLTIGQDYPRLPGDLETILFRVSQEALTNIARHAQAAQAWIDLKCDDGWVILQIEDDGVGFDPAAALEDAERPAGWGLVGIQERVRLANGEVQIHSEPGKGTRLIVKVPFERMGGIEHAAH